VKTAIKNNAGFSLIELIIAMTLLVGVGAMTMYSFSSSAKMTQPGGSVAYNLARGLMEQMHEYVRQDHWGDAGLPLSVATTPSPGTSTALSAFTPQNTSASLNGKTYTATYVVNDGSSSALDTNSDGREDFRKVTMTVSW